jgi:hypothetical protein
MCARTPSPTAISFSLYCSPLKPAGSALVYRGSLSMMIGGGAAPVALVLALHSLRVDEHGDDVAGDGYTNVFSLVAAHAYHCVKFLLQRLSHTIGEFVLMWCRWYVVLLHERTLVMSDKRCVVHVFVACWIDDDSPGHGRRARVHG